MDRECIALIDYMSLRSSYANTPLAVGMTRKIRPSKGWPSLNLKNIWEYRELLYMLVWRDVKVRYKQTVLGVVWAVMQTGLYHNRVQCLLRMANQRFLQMDCPILSSHSVRYCRGSYLHHH